MYFDFRERKTCIKKLAGKKLITYTKYKGVRLTEEGYKNATFLLRKHRLWKTFLVQTLGFPWEEIEPVAEELEHIHSEQLINRLDSLLSFPKFDPHGNPIPNANGKYTLRSQTPLYQLQPGIPAMIIGVKKTDAAFLKYLTEKGIRIGIIILIISVDAYDQSVNIRIDAREIILSLMAAEQILIKPV